MKRTTLCTTTCLSLLAVAVLTAGQPAGRTSTGPRAALEAMADAERAFAKMASDKGVRDAFVEFFADDSIGFYPKPLNAREFYRNQPPTPPTRRLEWEPRTGDIAASGELGWLTGPFTSRDTASNTPPRNGCYFSIWAKRPSRRAGAAPCPAAEPNCEWQVLMDVGIGTPEPVAFERLGVAPVGEPRGRFAPSALPGGTRDDSLSAAERALGETARNNLPEAYRGMSDDVSRLHVPGRQPIVGANGIVEYASQERSTLVYTVDSSTLARSRDLGFAYGSYGTSPENAGPATTDGYYVRMWKRGADGQWALAVEVRSPLPPSK